MTERLIGSTSLVELPGQGSAQEQAVLAPDESNGDSGTDQTLPERGVLYIHYPTDRGSRFLAVDSVYLEPDEEGGIRVGKSRLRVKPGEPGTLVPDSEPRRNAIRALDQAGGGGDLAAMAGLSWAIKQIDARLSGEFVTDNEVLFEKYRIPATVTKVEVRTGPRPQRRTER